jgi:hypothetical protein
VIERIEKALGFVVLRVIGVAAVLAATVYAASYLEKELAKK